jgi:hypothetical protein
MPGAAERRIHQDRSRRVEGRREEREHPVDHDRQMSGWRRAHRTPFRRATCHRAHRDGRI